MMGTKRDIAEDTWGSRGFGMHLNRYVKFHFVLFSILLRDFVMEI
jgi:hypothetical protein